MKAIIKKKPNKEYIAHLKRDLILFLSHLERVEPRRREHFHHSKNLETDIQSLIFLSGEAG